MSSYYSEQNTVRNLTSSPAAIVAKALAAKLELELYYSQCKENYHLDSRKIVLNDNTLIIMGSIDNDLFRRKIQTNCSRTVLV